MSTSKWKGAAGLAYTGDVTTAASTLRVYPIAETIDAKGEPATYERVTSQQPDVLNVNRAGMNYSFSVDGMQGNCQDVGYLLWLLLGDDAYTTLHTVTPANDSNYFGFNVDRKLDIGTSEQTERYLGCRIGSLTFEQPTREYARCSFSGLAADKHATLTAALSPSPPTGTNNQPLDWGALGAGFCKLGYAGAATAQDNDVQGFKIEITRNQAYGGFKINTGQPSSILEGGRRITFEISREFSGANAIAGYEAWRDNDLIELDVKYVVGAWNLRINIPEARITGSFAHEIGTGEDAIMATLVCTATKPDGADIITAEITDGFGGVYA